MPPEQFAAALALAAALSWGLSAVFVRQGLRFLGAAPGTVVSLAVGFVFTTLLVVVFQPETLTSITFPAILSFALIGILNFPLGRFFNYLSISRLGIGRSTPILASSPLFAMALAVIFSGESVNLGTLAGTALILAGLYATLMPNGQGKVDASGG